MTSARSAATTRPMSAASRQPPAYRKSISRFTAHLRSRWFARWSTPPMAEWMQQLHPLRLQYEVFSNAKPVDGSGCHHGRAGARSDRKPAAADNPFVAMQENVSRQIVAGLDAWRDMTEALAERTFLAVYGSPSLQAAVGIDPAATRPLRKAGKEPAAPGAPAEARLPN